MTTTVRYEPWTLHRQLVNEVNRLFERSGGDASSAATADWVPPVDIEEYADRFELHVDLPGVDPKTVELTMDAGVLTLAGNREQAVEKAGVERRRSERVAGRFYRRFALPDTVNADAVSARGNNGVLEISIPKRPTAQPRRIEVTH